MTILQIVYHPHPVLRQMAEPVTEFNDSLKKLVQDMIETMYHARGCGLAAPQVAIGKRIAVLDVTETHDSPFCIINPEIVEKEGEAPMEAGCLSVPGTCDAVPRYTKVKVRAQDENGKPIEITAENDLLCHALQHEIDHLNGKLYIDYFSPLKKGMLIKKMEKFLRRK